MTWPGAKGLAAPGWPRFAHVGPWRLRTTVGGEATKEEKTPPSVGVSWACVWYIGLANPKRPRRWPGGRRRGSHSEAARAGLHEPGLRALDSDLAQNRGRQRGVGGLAAGAGPVTLGGHRANHLLGAQRLAGLGQDPGGGVEGRHLLLLGLGRRLGLAFALLAGEAAGQRGIERFGRSSRLRCRRRRCVRDGLRRRRCGGG